MDRESTETTREILTHALALESRNALSRVELAAGELARFETTPRVVEILATIHEAVGEIDGLLGKIGLLSAASTRVRWPAIDVSGSLESVLRRISPMLAARGFGLEAKIDESMMRELRLVLPREAFERLLLVFFRVGFAEAARGDRFSIDARRRVGGLEFSLIQDGGATPYGSSWAKRSAARLDLETGLAEWGGRLVAAGEGQRLGFWVPVEALDV